LDEVSWFGCIYFAYAKMQLINDCGSSVLYQYHSIARFEMSSNTHFVDFQVTTGKVGFVTWMHQSLPSEL
jgi:hypothetical protein